ncbi:MAG: carbamoyltransferase [Bacteroidota bacterium]|nr:carbamoyltransferase [Bacteroidota bacterium]
MVKPKNILGISAFYHDAAAALIIDGKIIAAAQEERFTRVKNTADFPTHSIKYCLDEAGLNLDDLDAVVYYEKPFLKFERLLQTYYAFAPKGFISFLKAIPVWINEKLFIKKLILDNLKTIEPFNKKQLKLLFSEHHLSHAASTFFVSPFRDAAIITMDGVGEWSTATISQGNNNKIKLLQSLNFPHSPGLLYSAFTYYLGFRVNSGEYKMMGLAPYGNPESRETKGFIHLIKTHLADVKSDGSIWLNQKYFNYATGLTMVKSKKWKKLFGFPRRKPESKITQQHCNLAFAIQAVTEEIVIKMAYQAKKLTNADNLCMAGGVALNSVANGVLADEGIFKNIFIQPAAGDAGGAPGAALAVEYMYYDNPRKIPDKPRRLNNQRGKPDAMKGAFLGPEFSDKDVIRMNNKYNAVSKHFNDYNQLTEDIAKKLANGNVVGWFRGRMEFGPRALGNRSILADPRNPDMQKKLNLKIKYRESFRPFAPAVLAEDSKKIFDLHSDSPYMLLVTKINKKYRHDLPENYYQLPVFDKLYIQRSNLPAITHIDFSARVQTVHMETNPDFHRLISAFKSLTSCPVLVNTSFNVRGEPIVCTPGDAYRCFMATEMDYLIINNFLYTKNQQPQNQ